MSRQEDLLIQFKEKGYTVTKDGDIISPFSGKIKKKHIDYNGYYRVCFRSSRTRCLTLNVHRIIGYFKYGDKIFDSNLEIRHLDNDKLNNKWDNLVLGTSSENQFDKPIEQRINCALSGSQAVKIHDHESILRDRQLGMTYVELMEKYNISSKGTVSFIINKSRSNFM